MKSYFLKSFKIFLCLIVLCVIGSYFGSETSYATGAGYIKTGIGDADCSTSGNYCDGHGTYWVFRHTCKGYTSASCPDGLKEYGLYKKTQGRQSVDSGVACGMTVQIDVHTVDCSQTACSNATLKGWMLWYSGDCPVATNTPTKSPTKTPTPKPTATPTNRPTATPTNRPTATPTNRPTATPTNRPTATPTNRPTATPTNRPTATPTNRPTATPTKTPTPTIDLTKACDCDGIETTGIAAGRKVTVTAYAKVEGSFVGKARVNTMSIYVRKDNTLLAYSGDVKAVVAENTATKVRYKVTWSFTMPSQIDRGATYTIGVNKITCVAAGGSAMVPSSHSLMLVAAATKNPGILDSVMMFFGFKNTTTQSDSVQQLPETQSIKDEGTEAHNSLQLLPYYPAQITAHDCRSIAFKF